jgi:hypothetical protein
MVENTEGKKSHGRPRRRWEDNNETDLRVTMWEGVDWISLAE